MKKIILGLISLSSVAAFAVDCHTWKSDGPYSIRICAEQVNNLETSSKLEGLYLESVFSPGKMGIKRTTSKTKICEAMGFSSYVSDSAVIEKLETPIIRGDQAIVKKAKVITELECK